MKIFGRRQDAKLSDDFEFLHFQDDFFISTSIDAIPTNIRSVTQSIQAKFFF